LATAAREEKHDLRVADHGHQQVQLPHHAAAIAFRPPFGRLGKISLVQEPVRPLTEDRFLFAVEVSKKLDVFSPGEELEDRRDVVELLGQIPDDDDTSVFRRFFAIQAAPLSLLPLRQTDTLLCCSHI
jgi:hypothetical protein